MAHWTEIPNKRGDFHKLAYVIMHKAGMFPELPPMLAEPWKKPDYQTRMEAFRQTTDLHQYETIPDALEDLKLWIATQLDRPKHADNVAVLKVEITRHYGAVSITYGLSGSYEIQYRDDITKAYAELREIVEAQHHIALANNPDLMPAPPTGTNQSGGQSLIELLCTHVRREFVDGKDRIRLVGGEFTKYGIPVYDEFMSSLGIDPETLPYGDTPYEKRVKVQLDHKGNPKRALELA